jgi:hypothetical protein
MSTVDSLVSSF